MLGTCVLDRAVGASKKFELYFIDQGRQNFFFFFWQRTRQYYFLALWVILLFPIVVWKQPLVTCKQMSVAVFQ